MTQRRTTTPDAAAVTPPPSPAGDISACVRTALERYFDDLRGEAPCHLHAAVMALVEPPLLAVVMQRAGGNQRLAAEWLGINRNTLRRKLLDHHLL